MKANIQFVQDLQNDIMRDNVTDPAEVFKIVEKRVTTYWKQIKWNTIVAYFNSLGVPWGISSGITTLLINSIFHQISSPKDFFTTFVQVAITILIYDLLIFSLKLKKKRVINFLYNHIMFVLQNPEVFDDGNRDDSD
jgi:hypothetical protein